MTIASSLLGGPSFLRSDTLIQNREQLDDLNRQLATGERATTYGGLGSDRVQSISLRADISRLEAYQSNIDVLAVRVDLTVLALDRLEEIRIEARDVVDPNNFIDLGNGETFTQQAAENFFLESVALLNSQTDGRYIFGGDNVLTQPVDTVEVILDGDGSGAEGLRGVTEERLRADLGNNGLGRLDTDIDPLTPSTVTLSEEAATDFGFDINAVENNLSNVNVTVTGTEPQSIDVEFTGQPEPEETFRVFLDLPDGTQEVVELTAGIPDSFNGSFEIGATPDDTAQNFNAALRDRLDFTARTELNAASRITTARDFFDTEAGRIPQRVDTVGGTIAPEDATGLRNATAADTIFYYNGQNDTDPPREGLQIAVDDTITVNYGLRANEAALRDSLTVLAAFSIGEFTSGTEQENQAVHNAFALRARADLAVQVNQPSVQSVTQEIAGIQAIAGNADQRHTAFINTLDGIREEIERADPTEVATQLLSLQTQLEASFAAASAISDLSLVNFL
ncbi:MAG: hypothetical protein AAGE61_13910 [Pseudomonadota bacterium]